MINVGIWGTFDVDNYGDQLFPRIVHHELAHRLPRAAIRTFSPLGWQHPTRFDGVTAIEPLGEWCPTRVTQLAADLDAVIVGGGEIVHFNDRMLAPVYGIPPDDLARINASAFFVEGLGHDLERTTPVLWNAVGVAVDPGAADARRLAAALNNRPYVAVRDAVSLRRLRESGVVVEISVVPDTALVVDRIVPLGQRRAAVDRLRQRGDLPRSGPFVVLQGCDLLVAHVAEVASVVNPWLDAHPLVPAVLIETGPCRGDGIFADALTPLLTHRPYRVPLHTTGIDDIAAVIGASDGFIGSSLHGSITALAFSRPFLLVNFAAESKLQAFADLVGQPSRAVADRSDLQAALSTNFARPVSTEVVRALQARVDTHFDRMAAIIQDASGRRPRTIRRRLRNLVAARSHPQPASRSRYPDGTVTTGPGDVNSLSLTDVE